MNTTNLKQRVQDQLTKQKWKDVTVTDHIVDAFLQSGVSDKNELREWVDAFKQQLTSIKEKNACNEMYAVLRGIA
jgi:hypothetical protein